MVKDKTFAKLVVKGKIESLLNKEIYSNFNDFMNKNPNLEEFINNTNLRVVLSHSNDSITNEDYLEILQNMKTKYNINDVSESTMESLQENEELENTIVLPFIEQKDNEVISEQSYQIVKKKDTNLKNGFIDAAILAFVTGSIFGALFINLYINILRTLS